MQEPALSSFQDLRIEVAAHRLVIRAILAYLACAGHDSAQTLTQICGMLEGTGAYPVTVKDWDDELRQAAIARARDRMADFIVDALKVPLARA